SEPENCYLGATDNYERLGLPNDIDTSRVFASLIKFIDSFSAPEGFSEDLLRKHFSQAAPYIMSNLLSGNLISKEASGRFAITTSGYKALLNLLLDQRDTTSRIAYIQIEEDAVGYQSLRDLYAKYKQCRADNNEPLVFLTIAGATRHKTYRELVEVAVKSAVLNNELFETSGGSFKLADYSSPIPLRTTPKRLPSIILADYDSHEKYFQAHPIPRWFEGVTGESTAVTEIFYLLNQYRGNVIDVMMSRIAAWS
ncbi:unnamed protein product, partial [marine sediment metagenome]